MDKFDRHFNHITKMQRRMMPLFFIFVAIKIGVIGFLLWLAWQVVNHFIA